MPVFWIRSVRRRPAAFTVLAAVSLLAVVTAALSPMLLRAVQQSALARAVAEAGPARTAVFGLADAAPGQAETGLGAAVAIAEGAGYPYLWRSSTTAVESDDAVQWSAPGAAERSARVSAVARDCGGVVLAAGRCARTIGEVVVADGSGVAVGDAITVRSGRRLTLRVVGLSVPGSFALRPLATAGLPVDAASTDLVVALDQLDALSLGGTAVAYRPLARVFRLEDVDTARLGAAAAEEARLGSAGAATDGRVVAGIGGVLDEVEPSLTAAAVLLGLLALDAVGLAWFATASVVQRLARARAAELGLARLRALPVRRRAASAVLEPAIAIVLGGVLGFPAALAIAAALAPSAVDPLQPAVLVAAALALLGSLVALVVAALSAARAPLGDLLRATTEPRRAGRVAVAAQAAIVVAAAAALFTLTSGDGASGGIALLAPVLLALVVGTATARAAAVLLGRPRRRAPRRVAVLLAGRRIGRSPSVLTGAVAVLVGLAVAAFAVQLAATSALAQRDRADAAVGAGTVLTVAVPASVSLRGAVAAADPGGRSAMAAAELPSGRGVGRLLAVDTSRFAAVTTWHPAWSPVPTALLTARLAPRLAPPLVLTGTTLSIRLADVQPGRIETPLERLRLRAVLAAPGGWRTVVLGAPHDGQLRAPAPCASGCRLIALQAVAPAQAPTPFTLDATVTAISTDRQPAARFAGRLTGAQWRNRLGPASDPTQAARASVSDGADGLAVAFEDVAGGGTPAIAVRDVPEPVPVLLGPRTATDPFAGVQDAVSGIGLDQETLLLRPVGRAAILPRTLDDGALADLGVLERSSDPARDAATEEVWLAPGADPAIVDRLRTAGLRVLGRSTLTAAVARYDRDAPALAASAAPLIGAVCVLLVLLARLGGGLLDAPARRRDTRAVRLAGVRGRTVRRAVSLEVAVPLAVAVLLGTACGAAAFLLIAPHLQLVAAGAAAPPLDAALAPLPLVGAVLGGLILAGLVALTVAAVETAPERPS